jgi:hypothetical protein
MFSDMLATFYHPLLTFDHITSLVKRDCLAASDQSHSILEIEVRLSIVLETLVFSLCVPCKKVFMILDNERC